jgi:tetratricopeptide (TPR) repeat protein
MFREVGDQRGTASTLGNLGNVLVETGELTAARKHYEEGLKIQKETGYRRGQAYALSNLADVLTVTGDFPEARKLAEQALALRKELGENTNVAISQQELGWIAFNEGRLKEAEGHLRDAAPAFQKADMFDNLISCNALLARVLLADARSAEAGRLAVAAQQMAKSRPSRPPQFDAVLALASVQTAEGKFADAAKAAQDVMNLATRYGYVGYQMESRLMLVQMLAKSGKGAQARVQAGALQRDARAKGYGRIEREAAKLSGR